MSEWDDQLATLDWSNRYVEGLPGDFSGKNRPRQVEACYSTVKPRVASKPRLIHYSTEMAETLGLAPEFCENQDFAELMAGNRLLSNMQPYAMNYGGHQFGNWASQLGDGRAIALGDLTGPDGRTWTLQLKGAGPTPYSRTADGLAVLRSSVREYVCSEAMHYLGVPTTRALSLVLTGDKVIRDMFYDGHPQAETGAVVCRVAPSFIRFGHFELPVSRGDRALLKTLADYCMATDFPHLAAGDYGAWYAEVCERTADLLVLWQCLGFVHGVMNTDNMSILGQTIDYGPYGWLEGYDPRWTPNTTDAELRRYCYGRQPQVALWNLKQLGQALRFIMSGDDDVQAGMNLFIERYNQKYESGMAAKLGLNQFDTETDQSLLESLLGNLQLLETDMTLFFRHLADFEPQDNLFDTSDEQLVEPLLPAFYSEGELTPEVIKSWGNWLREYNARLGLENITQQQRVERMNAVNPLYVPRNYLAQEAIDAIEKGDNSLLDRWLTVLKNPYTEQPGQEHFAGKRPEWARHRPGCSMLSCSS